MEIPSNSNGRRMKAAERFVVVRSCWLFTPHQHWNRMKRGKSGLTVAKSDIDHLIPTISIAERSVFAVIETLSSYRREPASGQSAHRSGSSSHWQARRRGNIPSRLPICHRHDHELLLGRNAQPLSAGVQADDGDFDDCAKATTYADDLDVFAANVSDGHHLTG